MCRLSTVTLIVKIFYIICYTCVDFSSNDDSVINQGRIIHTGTVPAYMVLFRRITMNLSFVCLFFMVKREHNEVAKFFKMFSIFQMMFIKEVILIQ